MSLMPDPLVILHSLQRAVGASDPASDPPTIGQGYVYIPDEINGGKRYSYVKVIDREVQALSIFGLTDPIGGVTCYSLGYAVSERHRGRGLAVEAVQFGLRELASELKRTTRFDSFYIEAMIDQENVHSVKVAETLFLSSGHATADHYTATPSLHFKKLVLL